MKKVIVIIASKNPVKVQAAVNGFQKMLLNYEFDVKPVSVSSDVTDQPLSDEETLTGAINRVKNANALHPDAHFWVGIEGGVARIRDELAAFAWVIVKSRDGTGKARSGTFFLPKAVTDLIDQGMELGAADDIIFGSTNSKQQAGAVGLLTGNVVDRKQLYEQAVVLALISFKNMELYKKEILSKL